MGIDRERHSQNITFTCDGARCNEICETHTANFDNARSEMKLAGWQIKRMGDQWLHLCPDHRVDHDLSLRDLDQVGGVRNQRSTFVRPDWWDN